FIPQHYIKGESAYLNGHDFYFDRDGFGHSNEVLLKKDERYAPDRGFTEKFPFNDGKAFSYWKGIDNLYKLVFNDDNALYTNGSFTPKSTASTRFNEGLKAGEHLLMQLQSGNINLKKGETIKIVGHSQGAAFAAGIASVLARHSKYAALLEFVDYISPHQPDRFKHPQNIPGRQYSTENDRVSSNAGLLGWLINFLNGKSSLGRIDGTSEYLRRSKYKGGLGGHYIETWLNDLIKYWKDQGINVTVYE